MPAEPDASNIPVPGTLNDNGSAASGSLCESELDDVPYGSGDNASTEDFAGGSEGPAVGYGEGRGHLLVSLAVLTVSGCGSA